MRHCPERDPEPPLHESWSKSEKRLQAPIHGGTWQGEMRLGRRLFRTRSQGARESNSQPGEVTTRMRLGCSCLVWGTLFMSSVAWCIPTCTFERPSHLAESAPSCLRVEISSVARFNRIRVGQLDNFKTALAARFPLHAPAAPSYAGWAAGSGASCKGPASASPLAMGESYLRSLGPLCRMKAGRFQALPLARSVLSRELRRKGPVRWESQRGLATSET